MKWTRRALLDLLRVLPSWQQMALLKKPQQLQLPQPEKLGLPLMRQRKLLGRQQAVQCWLVGVPG